MRSSKSRSRSKPNRPRTLGNVINRVFDSSGPEGKVRGTPAQLIEKYQFLARDAQLSNDRVAAENFLQHAEHYTRLLAEANRELAAEQESRQQFQQQGSQNGGSQTGGSQNGGQNGNQNGAHGQHGQNQQNRDRPQGGERDQRRDDRGDYRPEYRPEYRADLGDDQPIVTAHDLVDHLRDDDAGLVETPEAAPRPVRQDEQRRGERPRFERSRDEHRRGYPPRVDQSHQDRVERPVEAKVSEPRPPEPKPAAQKSEHRPPRPKPVLPVVQAVPAEVAPLAAKPRAATRSRAPKKPADAVAADVAAKDVAGE